MSHKILNGQFVKKSKNVVTCVNCSKDFKYHNSTSSLSYHLKAAHGITGSVPTITAATRSTRTSTQLEFAKTCDDSKSKSQRDSSPNQKHADSLGDNCADCLEYHKHAHPAVYERVIGPIETENRTRQFTTADYYGSAGLTDSVRAPPVEPVPPFLRHETQTGAAMAAAASTEAEGNDGSDNAGSPPEFIIKSETDNEAWIATLQSIEPGSGSQHQVSAPSSAASPTNNSASQSPCPPAALGDSPAIVSSVQKRMHESKNATPPASQHPAKKPRQSSAPSKELFECSISQLLTKLRGVIDEKNIEVDQHIRRMRSLTSRESEIVAAISWRMGV